MHTSVIDVGRDGSIIPIWDTIRLLFIADEMFHTGYDILLQTFHGQGGGNTAQIWIVGKALPVAPATGELSQRAPYNRTKGNINAFSSEFSPFEDAGLSDQGLIP